MPITDAGKEAPKRCTYDGEVSVGDHRAFRDRYGGWTVGDVDVVWYRTDGRPPLLNLRLPDNSVVTSVPHHSDVGGADGFYWE